MTKSTRRNQKKNQGKKEKLKKPHKWIKKWTKEKTKQKKKNYRISSQNDTRPLFVLMNHEGLEFSSNASWAPP
jgi:hypothetical protein